MKQVVKACRRARQARGARAKEAEIRQVLQGALHRAHQAFTARLDDLRRQDGNKGTDDLIDRAFLEGQVGTLCTLLANGCPRVTQIQQALQELDAGRYGQCMECGEAISKPRLRALPWAVTCVDCRSKEEPVRLVSSVDA